MTEAGPGAGMIDWDLAVKVGSRLVGEGPRVTPVEAHDAVAELRADADRSTALVRDFTGLVATERSAPVLVVDRPGWVQAPRRCPRCGQAARWSRRRGSAPAPPG